MPASQCATKKPAPARAPRGLCGLGVARFPRCAALALAVILADPRSARADQVSVAGENFPGAEIADLRHGKLIFRAADHTNHEAWISDVDLIVVDRAGVFDDFNRAERFLAEGDPEAAIVRYRRTLRLSEAFWSDLIAVRLLKACDRAGRLDQATMSFVRAVRSKRVGSAAVRLLPRSIPDRPTPAAMRAVQNLEGALETAVSNEQRLPLELFRFVILARTGDARVESAAHTVASLEIPAAQHCPDVCSVLIEAFEILGNSELDPEDLAGLDRAIRGFPEALLPRLLLIKGQALLAAASTRDEIIRATWPLMRIVAHVPDDALAAAALYETALALERIGRAEKGVDLLKECLAHAHVQAETAQSARAALERLNAQPQSP